MFETENQLRRKIQLMRYKNSKSQWAHVDPLVEKSYLDACLSMAENEINFKNFRKNPAYGAILEGGEVQIGIERLERIKAFGGTNWLVKNLVEFEKNDDFGMPIKHKFEISSLNINSKLALSSSIINYANDIYGILDLVKGSKISKIVEVGGGYGGLCRMLSTIIPFEEYVLIDQPEPLKLAKMYLKKYPSVEKKISYISSFDKEAIQGLTNIDLFIGCNSIAELGFEEQDFYSANLISKSNFGYIVYNTLHIRSSRRIFKKVYKLWKKNFLIAIDSDWFDTLHIYLFKDNNQSFFNSFEINSYFNLYSSIKRFLKLIGKSFFYKVSIIFAKCTKLMKKI
jgi:hypothetical protein